MSILFEAVEPISQIVHVFNRNDEDTTDRLNHKYSTIIFILLGIITTANQYVGETIKCWTPAQFPESWNEYANQICWISNTYYIPMSETNILTEPRKEIVYYQWVPLVLFLQSILFYIPSVFWSSLNRSIGMDINKIVRLSRDVEYLNPESRDTMMLYVVRHIHRAFDYAREINSGPCSRLKSRLSRHGLFCGKRYGNFLILIYLITKIIYIGNVCVQLYMLNRFLGTDYMIYGVEVLQDVAESGTYRESRRFPRVTLCDFEVRALGRNMPHTVQCTLPVNLFNEKIFIFVWFWLVFVGLLNFLSLLSWVWITFATNRIKYVRKYLKVFQKYNKNSDKERLQLFCNSYLRQDGYFVLRMIGKNTNEVVVGELIDALWDHFSNHVSHHVANSV